MKALSNFYAKLSKSERRILAVTLVFLGIAFVDRVIVMPIVSTLVDLSRNVHEQETAIRKSMNMLLHKDTILAEHEVYMSYSVEAKSPEEETVGLLKEVEAVAEKSGVSLLYVKPGTVKEENATKKYYANLECEGTMEKVATFFHDIESSSQLIKIEKYQIQPKNKESSLARSIVVVYKTVLMK